MKTTSILFLGIIMSLAIFILVTIAGYSGKSAQGHIEFNLESAGGEIAEQDLDNPKMLWGELTNLITGNTRISGTFSTLPPLKFSFRSGINVNNGLIIVSLKTKRVVNPAYRAIENFTTNLITAYLPEYNERFAVTLIDVNGVAVQKTKEGLSIGESPSLKPNTQQFQAKHNLPLWPKSIFMQELDPVKYFVIEKPGLYKLTLTQRLYVVKTNTFLETITLPPVTVDVRVEN